MSRGYKPEHIISKTQEIVPMLTCDSIYALNWHDQTVEWRKPPFLFGDLEKISGETPTDICSLARSHTQLAIRTLVGITAQRASVGPGGGSDGPARSRLGQAEAKT